MRKVSRIIGRRIKRRASVTKSPKKYLTIGDISEYTGVSRKTIRKWIEKLPDVFESDRLRGKRRRFSRKDLERIIWVQKLIFKKGFRISAINEWLFPEELI